MTNPIPITHPENTIEDALLRSLAEKKRVPKAQLQQAKSLAVKEGVPMYTTLLRSGVISERSLLENLADVIDAEINFDLSDLKVDHGLIAFLTPDYLHSNALIPLQFEDGRRCIVTSDPLNQALFDMVAFCLEEPITPVLAERHVINEMLDHILKPYENPDKLETSVSESDLENLKALANEAPVVRFIQDVIAQGIDRKASDIHLEPTEKNLKVRFRLNGRLSLAKTESDLSSAAVLSRLKVLAQLNISERRKPQDGRISFFHSGRKVDLRLSTLPTQHGESAVLRILDQSHLSLDWSELGFQVADVKDIRRLIQKPNGLILVTGPTGSGKTTTLYTALAELNAPDRKLFTVEDPIEYDIPGINQIQVNPAIGFDFATALRSILRQDPNIIMIGEIRDLETAEIACRAALVGRLVLSTLHTNSAAQAVTRLKDLGVPEYLLEATLKGVLEQSLEISICDACNGAGCKNCGGSGSSKRRLRYGLLEPFGD